MTPASATRSSDAVIVAGSALAITAVAYAATAGVSRLAQLALPAAALQP